MSAEVQIEAQGRDVYKRPLASLHKLPRHLQAAKSKNRPVLKTNNSHSDSYSCYTHHPYKLYIMADIDAGEAPNGPSEPQSRDVVYCGGMWLLSRSSPPTPPVAVY